jgi:hypothetical protein
MSERRGEGFNAGFPARRAALARVQARLQTFTATGDSENVLGPEALADAEELTGAVPDMNDDPEVGFTLGYLY